MLIEYMLAIAIGITLVYAIIGVGIARAERQARNSDDLDLMTILFWPIATLVWAISKKV